MKYELGRLAMRSVSSAAGSETVYYYPGCSCGTDHIRKTVIENAARSLRMVHVFAAPGAPDSYSRAMVGADRLTSSYNYLNVGGDWKQHGTCCDYDVDQTVVAEYNEGKMVLETINYVKAGVVHEDTIDYK